MFQVVKKLNLLKQQLKTIHMSHFSNIVEEVAKDKVNLLRSQEELQKFPLNTTLQLEEKAMGAKFKRSSHLAEIFLQQRSKATWIRAGDRNTRYFFSVIKHRKLMHTVTQLQDDQMQYEPDTIANIFVDYYKKLLGEQGECRGGIVRWFLENGYRLTATQQMQLLGSYTDKEVKEAMWGINVNTSPGLDGFGSSFFKEAWDIVGSDVTEAVLEFLRNGKLLKQINATIITLIPKVANPLNAVFVQASVLMKIDLRKAYDMVRWDFLAEMMLGFGFPRSFTQLVMTCVTTTTFSVKVNGIGHGYFEGKKGMRQKDPISLLLFVMVMEYLSRILNRMSQLPDFKCHLMCKRQKLSHLIFANDLIIFCKANDSSVKRVMEALHHFSEAYGLVANIDKSHIFIAGVDKETKARIVQMIGFILGNFPIRYLGLPLSPQKWNKMECHQLIVKITEKIRATSARHLSYAGKLQVINSVLFSVHNFWGAVFVLPQSVLNEVDRKCMEFLWGSSEEKKKLSLVAWEKICKPKKQGGLNAKGCKNWIKASADSSWYWKRLRKLKLCMVNWYRDGRYSLNANGKYSIMQGYLKLIGDTPKIEIAELVWNKISLPRFILWLTVQGRLLTKERMLTMGLQCENTTCILCDGAGMENAIHLFSNYVWFTQL
nr:uncharacterized protein LOC104112156 [Nicotiana tomentosiformis]